MTQDLFFWLAQIHFSQTKLYIRIHIVIPMFILSSECKSETVANSLVPEIEYIQIVNSTINIKSYNSLI